jgi:calcium-dependent protein kinase
MFEKLDSDGSGYIDFNEFLSAALDEAKVANRQNLVNTFTMFDVDGSGKISA